MKKTVCIVFILLLSAFCACGKPKPQATPAPSGPLYHAMGDIVTGGTAADIADMNVKSLQVSSAQTAEGQETVLAFSFVTGSRMSGSTQETAGNGVPLYSIHTLDYPARLIVQFENIAFWDYRHGLQLNHTLLRGSFQHTVFGNPRVSITFQLTEPVDFFAEPVDDTLRIHLRTRPAAEEKEYYYVTANAYDAYRSGTLSLEFNASPTYASNMQDILMISPPMDTEETAQAYRQEAQQLFPSIPPEVWKVTTLKNQELPSYDKSLDYLAAFQNPSVQFLDGNPGVLPVVIPDGLFLCELPNNQGFLYSKELPDESGDSPYQQLVALTHDGGSSIVSTLEFAAVEQAQYSPDGRKLAVLERSGGSTHLYIFDADTYELLNDLSEMGFGDNTSAFTWNALGNIIYAITGTNAVQLHQFDYSIPDEAQRHSLIDRNSIDEGSLGYSNGELFFSHAPSADEGSIIYRIKPEGGVRKPFLKGDRLFISYDARYMALIQTNETSDAEKSDAGLSLYNMEDGSTEIITQAFYPYACVWARDCSKLYFIESKLAGGQTEEDTTDVPDDSTGAETTPPPENAAPEDPYPFVLWEYDIAAKQSKALLELAAPDIFASSQPNTLYLCHYVADVAGTQLRATYLLDLSSVFNDDATADTAPDAAAASPSPGA